MNKYNRKSIVNQLKIETSNLYDKELIKDVAKKTPIYAIDNIQQVKTDQKTPKRKLKMSILTTSMACMLMVIISSIVFIPPTVAENNVSLVTLDINPSVSFELDKDNLVTKAIPNNLDGQAFINDIEFTGKTIEEAIQISMQEAVELGYIAVNTDGEDFVNAVKLNVVHNKDDKAVEIADEIKEVADGYFKSMHINCVVFVDNTTLAMEQEAEKYGLTAGKLDLIKSVLIAENKDINNNNIKNYKEKSVRELNNLLGEAQLLANISLEVEYEEEFTQEKQEYEIRLESKINEITNSVKVNIQYEDILAGLEDDSQDYLMVEKILQKYIVNNINIFNEYLDAEADKLHKWIEEYVLVQQAEIEEFFNNVAYEMEQVILAIDDAIKAIKAISIFGDKSVEALNLMSSSIKSMQSSIFNSNEKVNVIIDTLVDYGRKEMLFGIDITKALLKDLNEKELLKHLEEVEITEDYSNEYFDYYSSNMEKVASDWDSYYLSWSNMQDNKVVDNALAA